MPRLTLAPATAIVLLSGQGLLGGGSMPLIMLEERIDRWIAATTVSRANP